MTTNEIRQIIEPSALDQGLKDAIMDRLEDDYADEKVDDGLVICDLDACLAFLRKQGIGDGGYFETEEEDQAAEQHLRKHFKKVLGEQNITIMTEDFCVLYDGRE